MRIVIAGTGTEIGKTHAGVAIVEALVARGIPTLGLKPIESGWTPEQSDGAALARASSFPPKPAPYTFSEAVSPHLAARRAGMSIQFERIDDWLLSHSAQVLLIETAGALLSPLGPGLTNLDWIRHLHPERIFLVAPDRLGVLHEVTACCLAFRTLGPELPEPWVILQAPPIADGSTGSNASELHTLGIAKVAASFPRASISSPELRSAAAQIVDLIVSRETHHHL